MRTLFLVYLLFLISCFSAKQHRIDLRQFDYSDDRCAEEINKALKIKIKESLGAKYDAFLADKGKIIMSVTIDSTGNLTELGTYKLTNVSEPDFKRFVSLIKKDVSFCHISYSPDITPEAYKKAGINKYKYTYVIQ